MAKVDEERAYVKALERVPLTEDEVNILKKLTAVDLLDMGTLSEAVIVKSWCRTQEYRIRSQSTTDVGPYKGYPFPPTKTYPFYEP